MDYMNTNFNELGDHRDDLIEKYERVIDIDGLPDIDDHYRRQTVAQLIENQVKDGQMSGSVAGLLSEAAPANSMGASAADPRTGNVQGYNPVMVSLIRRTMPNLLAYDMLGVQPMNAPVGLVFAYKSKYGPQNGPEALHDEAKGEFSATNNADENEGGAVTAQSGTSPVPTGVGDGSQTPATYTRVAGFSTAFGEAMGDSPTNDFNEMSLSIGRSTVTAKERALKAEFSVELAQDLMAWHGINAKSELSTMLSNEILAEINREVIRSISITAKQGAQDNVAYKGEFDLDVDSNGRWGKEKFQMMGFQIGRDCGAIGRDTRRGRGNFIITSSDMAEALEAANILQYNPSMKTSLSIDDTGNTFAGTISNGRIKVYIDPYFESADGWQYYTAGYKGPNPMDAGMFYCPYVPLKMYERVDEKFQPAIAFKTRYAMSANPFATTAGDGAVIAANKNNYYRLVGVKNLM